MPASYRQKNKCMLPCDAPCLTDPANIEGNAETAQVLGLTPWMDYEFRVLASNILGTGEPSGPSSRIRTKEAGQGSESPL